MDRIFEQGEDFDAAYSSVVITGPNALRSNDENAAGMMNRASLQRTVQRKAKALMPPAPISPLFIFPEEMKYLHDELFLQIHHNFEHAAENHTILVFGLQQEFISLCASDCWYVDGTFKVCPAPFYQLFTVHYFHMNRCIPSLYCLLSGKSQIVYETLFSHIRDLATQFKIPIRAVRCMADFETAIKNSIKLIWPLWTVEGCYFHFTQALYRKMEQLELKVYFCIILKI